MADISVDQYGFDWGVARITRRAEAEGHVFIGLTTPKADLEIRITPAGYVRIMDLRKTNGEEVKF